VPRDHAAELQEHYGRPEVQAGYAKLELTKPERALVERYLKPGARVLDVGCGTGRVALALAKLGYRTAGIDLAPGMVETARANAAALGLDVPFTQAAAEALPFEENSFDAAIFACNGIGHLTPEGKEHALGEMVRVTRPGGAILLSLRTPYALNAMLPGLAWRALSRSLGRLRGNPWQPPDETYELGVYVHRPSLGWMAGRMRSAGIDDVTVTTWRALQRGRPPGLVTRYVGGQFFLAGLVVLLGM
jgi:ubiquinone/menaquinone biosynthesis C-methylase UbiE